MDLAERDPVWHHGVAVGLGVTDDVGSVQQLRVFEMTHRASREVGVQYLLAEDRLMKSDPRLSHGVGAFRGSM